MTEERSPRIDPAFFKPDWAEMVAGHDDLSEPLRLRARLLDSVAKSLSIDDRIDLFAAGDRQHALLVVDRIDPDFGDQVKVEGSAESRRHE